MLSFFQAKQKNILSKDIFDNSTIVDVRSKEEFDTEPAKLGDLDIINIPVDQIIFSRCIPSIAKDSKIVLFCRSGNRSGIATEILKYAGYTNIINVGSKDHLEKIFQG